MGKINTDRVSFIEPNHLSVYYQVEFMNMKMLFVLLVQITIIITCILGVTDIVHRTKSVCIGSVSKKNLIVTIDPNFEPIIKTKRKPKSMFMFKYTFKPEP